MGYTVYDKALVLSDRIGDDSVISTFAFIDSGVVIGKRTRIKPHCYIAENTIIGDDCFISPGVMVGNDKKPPSKGKHWAPVVIGNKVSIGIGSIIVPGVRIGNGARIRAGSLVDRDVKDGEYFDETRNNKNNYRGCRAL